MANGRTRHTRARALMGTTISSALTRVTKGTLLFQPALKSEHATRASTFTRRVSKRAPDQTQVTVVWLVIELAPFSSYENHRHMNGRGNNTKNHNDGLKGTAGRNQNTDAEPTTKKQQEIRVSTPKSSGGRKVKPSHGVNNLTLETMPPSDTRANLFLPAETCHARAEK